MGEKKKNKKSKSYGNKCKLPQLFLQPLITHSFTLTSNFSQTRECAFPRNFGFFRPFLFAQRVQHCSKEINRRTRCRTFVQDAVPDVEFARQGHRASGKMKSCRATRRMTVIWQMKSPLSRGVDKARNLRRRTRPGSAFLRL